MKFSKLLPSALLAALVMINDSASAEGLRGSHNATNTEPDESVREMRKRGHDEYAGYHNQGCRTAHGGRGREGYDYVRYHGYSEHECRYQCQSTQGCKAIIGRVAIQKSKSPQQKSKST